ncbi:hypothetical protein BANRA_02944 [Escherichia coli]|nr:hypothetical protein [Escherichia coli]VDA89060.1 hypothetical protein BANRA_02944 [Escherichia coli]
MAISSYSTVTDKFATLTKMQDENLNEKIERKNIQEKLVCLLMMWVSIQ